jgi:uncharacterized repeat protein (TIGR01451 family)
MRKITIFSLILLSILFIFVNKVSADYGCTQYGQYGSCTPSQSILVDKLVGRPNATTTKGGITSYEYVDNLSATDPRYHPGEYVSFMIKIKNTSSTKLTNVTVKDFVPSYVEPIEGPGSYDGNSRTINFNAGDFNPDEEKIYYIKMQVNNQNSLPSDKGLFCLTNKAEGNSNNNAKDDDTAQFCIEKEVSNTVTKAPAAGPEMGLVLFSGELIALGAGLFLKRKLTYKV